MILAKSYGAPRITKDGVTVAKDIELEDKFENMGAQMVRDVASRTSDVAGDGTTTATVLAQAIVKEGMKSVAAGMNPMDFKRGIEKAVQEVNSVRLSLTIATGPAAPGDQRVHLAHHPLAARVYGTAARHSLVTSSMIVSTRNRRPFAS